MQTDYRLKAMCNVNEAISEAITYMDDTSKKHHDSDTSNDIYAYKLGMSSLIKVINSSALALKNLTDMAKFDRYQSGDKANVK